MIQEEMVLIVEVFEPPMLTVLGYYITSIIAIDYYIIITILLTMLGSNIQISVKYFLSGKHAK